MKTNLTAHGITMLDGWCHDVPEAELRRREQLAADRATWPYQRPCEVALERVRPLGTPAHVERERWRQWDAGSTMTEDAA